MEFEIGKNRYLIIFEDNEETLKTYEDVSRIV
jgi:hypothetical protein